MTEVSHLLAPGGWRIDFKHPGNTICTKLLPAEGTTLLIGRAPTGKACKVVWVDKAGKLQTLEKLVCKGAYWEGTFKSGGRDYVVTAWKGKSQNGKSPRIVGDVEVGLKSKQVAAAAAAWKPGTDFNMQGTWGAEANNPGG